MNISKMINERPFLSLVLICFGSAIIIIGVLLPMGHRIRELSRQEQLMMEDIKLLSGLLKNQEVKNMISPFVTLNEASKAIEEFLVLGKTQSITFLSILRHDKDKSLYKKIPTLPVEMETQSTYQQLGLFMTGLNKISQGLVLVESFQVIRDTEDPNKIKSKIRVHICLRKQEHGKK
jgi:hypothetical protein